MYFSDCMFIIYSPYFYKQIYAKERGRSKINWTIRPTCLTSDQSMHSFYLISTRVYSCLRKLFITFDWLSVTLSNILFHESIITTTAT